MEAVACQLAKQILLARVTAIERPDPDAGPRGHCRYGRVGVLEEDLAGRLEDARVVAARLSLAPAQLALDVVLHLDSIAGFVAEWTGTLRSVPQGESARSVPDVPAGRNHDPTVHDRHPAEPARRPAGPARARSLARRAARRRRLRRAPVVRSEPRRPLANALRLAVPRGAAQRLSAVHDRNRRPERPLPPRSLTRAERVPAHRHARLARFDRRVPRRDRSAERPTRARRRPRRRVRPRDPLDARLRILGPDPRARLEPLPDRRGVGRTHAPARLRALRRRRQRRRFDDLAGSRQARPRARRRRARDPDLLLPLGRPVGVRRHDRGGAARARHPAVVRREQDVVQHADGAAAADARLRDQRLAARPARLERPAAGRGPRSGLRDLERDAVLADRHGNVRGQALPRERPRRPSGRLDRRRFRSRWPGSGATSAGSGGSPSATIPTSCAGRCSTVVGTSRRTRRRTSSSATSAPSTPGFGSARSLRPRWTARWPGPVCPARSP